MVDLAPVSTDGYFTLADGSVVLSISATETDADAVAELEDIGVVRYFQLGEDERQALRERVNNQLRTRNRRFRGH